MIFFLLLFLSYVIGSIPSGLILAKYFKGVDIRDFGSGNIGATNVNRVLGKKLGALTLFLDFLKGLISVLLASFLLQDLVLSAWVGLAAVLGHCFPLYLKFKGGKGVATSWAVILCISFWAGMIAFFIWGIGVKISKISALGALMASLSLPFTTYFFTQNETLTGIVVLIVGLVIVRHKENIKRLLRGKEFKA